MKVKAMSAGIFGKYRQPGEVFEVPDNMKLGRWMQPLDAPAKVVDGPRVPGAGPGSKVGTGVELKEKPATEKAVVVKADSKDEGGDAAL